MAEHRHVACAVKVVSCSAPSRTAILYCVSQVWWVGQVIRVESTSALLLKQVADKPAESLFRDVDAQHQTKKWPDAISGQVAHLKVLRSVSAS
jgi:hypothetical protein